MTVSHSRHVVLTEPSARSIDRQAAAGRHASASEAARAALRLLTGREDARTGRAGGASQDASAHG